MNKNYFYIKLLIIMVCFLGLSKINVNASSYTKCLSTDGLICIDTLEISKIQGQFGDSAVISTNSQGEIIITLKKDIEGGISINVNGSFILDAKGHEIKANGQLESILLQHGFGSKIKLIGNGSYQKGNNYTIYIGSGNELLIESANIYGKMYIYESKLALTKENDKSHIELTNLETTYKSIYHDNTIISTNDLPNKFSIQQINDKIKEESDYTEVDLALDLANKLIPENYLDFNKVIDAINKVIRCLDSTKQGEVDLMAEQINAAIKALVYKDADYTAVNDAILRADQLNIAHYVSFDDVNTAKNNVVFGKNITEQGEVDLMAKQINDAIDALVYKDADYTVVNDAIARAEQLNSAHYVFFDDVNTAKNNVVVGKNITEQGEVDLMAKQINDAIDALVYKDADYTAVNDAIARAEQLNSAHYVSFDDVNTAKDNVVVGKNITEQGKVDLMAKQINGAIDALVYKDADYTAVDNAIARVNQLNKSYYENFIIVENAVNSVQRDKNITQQSLVDQMEIQILNAISQLKLRNDSSNHNVENPPLTSDSTSITLYFIVLLFSVTSIIILKKCIR